VVLAVEGLFRLGSLFYILSAVRRTEFFLIFGTLQRFTRLSGICNSAQKIGLRLSKPIKSFRKFHIRHTNHDNHNRLFKHGCNAVNKRFDEEFGDLVGVK